METRKSIFEIERRINLQDEHKRLVSFMKAQTVVYNYGEKESFYKLIDESVALWKYRNTAFNIRQYMMQIGVNDLSRDAYISDDGIIACLELYLNLIFSADKSIKKSGWDVIENRRFNNTAVKVGENIKYILEQINMEFSQVEDKVIIHKRDADVDSVIEKREELSGVLLGYLDFRNRKDINFKKHALITIADYMEGERSKYKALNSVLTDTLFYAFNSFGIRHNNGKQVSFKTDAERIDAYDKVFKVALHLLREEEIREFVENINAYKS